MPTVYIQMWDNHDREILLPFTYGKNGKRRKRPEALKPSPWQKVKDGYADLFNAVRGK